MRGLTEDERLDAALHAAWTMREKAREAMTAAVIAWLAAENRLEILLDRMNLDEAAR